MCKLFNKKASIFLSLILSLVFCISPILVSAEAVVLNDSTDYVVAEQVVLNVGADTSQRNLSWISGDSTPGEVRLAKASAVINSVFPDDYRTFSVKSSVASNIPDKYAKAATLTGLEPDTAYAYVIAIDDLTSKIYYFETDVTGDFDFIYVGDPQIATEEDGRSWLDTLQKIDQYFDVDLLVSGGDQVSSAKNEEQYSYLIQDELSKFTFAPTVGPAHDTPSATYSDHFNLPNLSTKYGVGTTSANYWYVYNEVLFMHLNMEDDDALYNGEHETFISETMAANPGVKWTILVAHRAPFSTGYHGNPDYKNYQTEIARIRPALSALATKMDIDIVFSAHDHVYVRTYMMENDQVSADTVVDNTAINPDGVLYITANSSTGSKFYDQTVKNAYFAAFENYEKRKSAIHFEVTDTSITLTSYFLDNMSAFDTFTIIKDEVSYTPSADERLNTPYGLIDTTENQNFADVDKYPIAVFDRGGTFLGAYADMGSMFSAHFSIDQDVIVFLRRDVDSLGYGFENMGTCAGNKIIDLNGKTLKIADAEYLFYAKAMSAGYLKVTVKNGTIDTAGKAVITIDSGTAISAENKRMNCLFDNVSFKNIVKPLVNDAEIGAGVAVSSTVTFTDCIFEKSTVSLFNTGNNKFVTLNIVVNGGNIVTNADTTDPVVIFGMYKDNASFNVFSGSDGKYLRMYMSKSSAPNEFTVSADGLVFVKNEDLSTDENDVYVLAEKTPYGYIDEEHLDSGKYPMVLYLGDAIIYPDTYGGESGNTVVYKYFMQKPSKDATLYFRRDYTITGANYWTGNISSKFVIDLGGYTIASSSLLYMQSRSSSTATIIVKNGTLIPTSSLLVYGTKSADKKHSEITFENVTFDNIRENLIGPAAFSTKTEEEAKYTMSANIYFNNCTFNVSAALTDPLFNFGDDTRGTLNVYINGGTVNFEGDANSVFTTADGTPRAFYVNQTGSAHTIVTLPDVNERYILISGDAVVVAKSVSLGELIDMNVYIKLLGTKDVIATLACGNESRTFDTAMLVCDSEGRYKLSLPLTSILMAENVTLRIDGGIYTTSVKEYAEALIASDESNALKALATALLNYGAAAQEYFAIKNNASTLDDLLANEGLSDIDKLVEMLTPEDLAAYKFSAEGMTEQVKFISATLIFSSKTEMKVYFNASSNAIVTVNGKVYEKIAYDEQYYVMVTAETPIEAMRAFEFVITDGETVASAEISVFTAIHAALSNMTGGTKIASLVTAYARYCEYADAYVKYIANRPTNVETKPIPFSE